MPLLVYNNNNLLNSDRCKLTTKFYQLYCKQTSSRQIFADLTVAVEQRTMCSYSNTMYQISLETHCLITQNYYEHKHNLAFNFGNTTVLSKNIHFETPTSFVIVRGVLRQISIGMWDECG